MKNNKNTLMDLTEAEARELQDAFDLFDKDGDGAIGLDDLGNVLAVLGQDASRDDLAALLAAADRDGNGVIDRAEFVALMAKHLFTAGTRPTPEAELAAAFRVFDRDGDGLIGPDELRTALLAMGEKVSQEDLERMIRAADKNGDGRIDFDEFVAMLR